MYLRMAQSSKQKYHEGRSSVEILLSLEGKGQRLKEGANSAIAQVAGVKLYSCSKALKYGLKRELLVI